METMTGLTAIIFERIALPSNVSGAVFER